MPGLSSWDTANLILAIVGAAGAVQQSVSYIKGKLPAQELKALEETYDATCDFLVNSLEDGSLNDQEDFVQKTSKELRSIKSKTKTLRARSHNATTMYQQLRGLVTGLSCEIRRLAQQTAEIRLMIAVKSGQTSAGNGQWHPSLGAGRGTSVAHTDVPRRRMGDRPAFRDSGDTHSSLLSSQHMQGFYDPHAQFPSRFSHAPGLQVPEAALHTESGASLQ